MYTLYNVKRVNDATERRAEWSKQMYHKPNVCHGTTLPVLHRKIIYKKPKVMRFILLKIVPEITTTCVTKICDTLEITTFFKNSIERE